MTKVEVITAKEKFSARQSIPNPKEKRITQMLELMALAYHTRSKKRIQTLSATGFIEVKRRDGAK